MARKKYVSNDKRRVDSYTEIARQRKRDREPEGVRKREGEKERER